MKYQPERVNQMLELLDLKLLPKKMLATHFETGEKIVLILDAECLFWTGKPEQSYYDENCDEDSGHVDLNEYEFFEAVPKPKLRLLAPLVF